MIDRLEFTSCNDIPQDKIALSARMAVETAAYLATGGEIQTVPYNYCQEIVAKVGQWSRMGSMDADFELEVIDLSE
tara:strand:- start:4416 stop:4643 length:228 start_codon:yes stop_codon:yes gene_type:complete